MLWQLILYLPPFSVNSLECDVGHQPAYLYIHIYFLGIDLLIGLASRDFIIIIKSIIIITVLYIQLFIYSYTGEKLTSQNDKLQVAIWNTPWYRQIPPNIAKDMMFIMMRSNSKFNFTAGKMYIMNLENYTRLVKSVVSVFTIMRLMFL